MTPRLTRNEPFLDAALRELKHEEAQVQPPAHLEVQVLAAWDGGRPRKGEGGLGFAPVAAVAAGVMLVLGVASWQVQRGWPSHTVTGPIESPTAPSASATPASIEGASQKPRLADDSGIEALEDTRVAAATGDPEPVTLVLLGEPIAAGETVRIVRMRVPGATLTELGLRSISAPRAQSVDLDVIVGEDGVARALRVGM